jgi:hypothetical protein
MSVECSFIQRSAAGVLQLRYFYQEASVQQSFYIDPERILLMIYVYSYCCGAHD